VPNLTDSWRLFSATNQEGASDDATDFLIRGEGRLSFWLQIAKETRELFERGRIAPFLLAALYQTYNPVPDVLDFVRTARKIFPRLNCGLASLYLQRRAGEGVLVIGSYNGVCHTFLEVNHSLIVDITADQFGGPSVYVGPMTDPWSNSRGLNLIDSALPNLPCVINQTRIAELGSYRLVTEHAPQMGIYSVPASTAPKGLLGSSDSIGGIISLFTNPISGMHNGGSYSFSSDVPKSPLVKDAYAEMAAAGLRNSAIADSFGVHATQMVGGCSVCSGYSTSIENQSRDIVFNEICSFDIPTDNVDGSKRYSSPRIFQRKSF
jgi:hypothetical protein